MEKIVIDVKMQEVIDKSFADLSKKSIVFDREIEGTIAYHLTKMDLSSNSLMENLIGILKERLHKETHGK